MDFIPNINDFSDQLGKIEDAGTVVRGGRIDRHWQDATPSETAINFFTNKKLEKWMLDSKVALEHFGLVSIEFGNWMSQQDRADFLYASMRSLHNLAKVVGFKDNQLGLTSKLSIALGARGTGSAAGHYEPLSRSVINLTKTKGVGVLAHEFGHALDNIISFHTNPKQKYVTGGRSTRTGYDETLAKKGNWFEQQFEEFFNILYFDKDGNKTEFLENISKLKDYWIRRTEVFARTFEVYIRAKLDKKKIKDGFLVPKTFSKAIYPTNDLVKKVTPILDNIVKKGVELMNKKAPVLNGVSSQLPIIGYSGFRKTLKQNGSLADTLENMKRIALRDQYQVEALAEKLEGQNVGQTAENIWNFIRENITYKTDMAGIEELRTPARTRTDGIGDCDDFTILASSIMLVLNINHEYRIASYHKKGKFEHIYPVAIDNKREYIIDAVPEIPHFNFEANPIIDLKILQMEIQELAGITSNEFKNDMLEELYDTNALNGIDNDYEDDLLESNFLAGFGEVDTEEQADIVLQGSDLLNIYDNGILAEVHKAKNTLANEGSSPTILSQTINVPKELERLITLIEVWEDQDERIELLETFMDEKSAYRNFYSSIHLATLELDSDQLNGIDNEPIYLQKGVDPFAYEMGELLMDEGLGRLRRKRKGRLKKFFKKVGGGLKKVAKAVIRNNPATIGTRVAITTALKLNVAKVASKLIYAYLTQEQAQKYGLDIAEWKKLVNIKNKAEKFYTAIGGRSEKFRQSIVKGKAAKVTGVQLQGLGILPALAAAPAAGFLAFVKKAFSKINPKRLFANLKTNMQERKMLRQAKKNASTGADDIDDSADYTEAQTADTTDSTDTTGTTDTTGVEITNEEDKNKTKTNVEKAKDFVVENKGKLIIGGVVALVILLVIILWKRSKRKKLEAEKLEKNQLRGIKAAKTRARNRRQLKGLSSGSSSNTRALPAPRKRSTSTRTKSTKNSNALAGASRLKAMHKKAKELRKKYPKTKYSTLLSRAAKEI